MALQQGDEPNFDSNDPYEVLGFRVPTSDPKEIKRAYRKLALKYHPDVAAAVTNGGKDKEGGIIDDEKARQQEAAKKRASDRFAKINWAYQVLSGKQASSSSASQQQSAAAGTRSSSSSGPGGGGGWTPPHRRPAGASSTSWSSTSSSSSSGSSTDWRDFTPGYDPSSSSSYEYDVGGDSLGAIFRDLVTGAAAGGRGVLKDFVEFLEQNVDGYSTTGDNANDDQELRVLLRTGSLTDIGDEMDTTELVMRQLAEKQRQLDEELVLVTAEAKLVSNYMEKLERDERAEEIKARKKVVESYAGKARKRLLSLQTRYKQLIVSGENDPKAGGGRATATGDYGATSSSWTDSRSPSSSPASGSSRQYSTSSSTSSSPQRPRHEKAEDAWKDDSFGSFGRGRGSSRRRSQQQASTSSSSSSPYSSDRSSLYSRAPYSPSSGSSSAGRTAYRAPSARSSTAPPPGAQPVPPRFGVPTYEQQMEDKRRLRDLKVDEEFDKLKKDLGL
jgi:hypothetical protein